MFRGRKPDAPEMQEAKGRPGKRRRPAAPAASTVASSAVQPTSKLGRSALHVWTKLAPELERMNFLRGTDSNAFARYCQTVAKYWEVSAELDRDGEVYWTETVHGKMKRINPLFLIQERLSRRLIELEDRFGLSPAARQQIMMRLAQQQPQLPLRPQGEAEPTTPPPDAGPIGILGSPKLH